MLINFSTLNTEFLKKSYPTTPINPLNPFSTNNGPATSKKMGAVPPSNSIISVGIEQPPSATSKKRGRPRKIPVLLPDEKKEATTTAQPLDPKQADQNVSTPPASVSSKRGRPRKLSETAANAAAQTNKIASKKQAHDRDASVTNAGDYSGDAESSEYYDKNNDEEEDLPVYKVGEDYEDDRPNDETQQGDEEKDPADDENEELEGGELAVRRKRGRPRKIIVDPEQTPLAIAKREGEQLQRQLITQTEYNLFRFFFVHLDQTEFEYLHTKCDAARWEPPGWVRKRDSDLIKTLQEAYRKWAVAPAHSYEEEGRRQMLPDPHAPPFDAKAHAARSNEEIIRIVAEQLARQALKQEITNDKSVETDDDLPDGSYVRVHPALQVNIHEACLPAIAGGIAPTEATSGTYTPVFSVPYVGDPLADFEARYYGPEELEERKKKRHNPEAGAPFLWRRDEPAVKPEVMPKRRPIPGSRLFPTELFGKPKAVNQSNAVSVSGPGLTKPRAWDANDDRDDLRAEKIGWNDDGKYVGVGGINAERAEQENFASIDRAWIVEHLVEFCSRTWTVSMRIAKAAKTIQWDIKYNKVRQNNPENQAPFPENPYEDLQEVTDEVMSIARGIIAAGQQLQRYTRKHRGEWNPEYAEIIVEGGESLPINLEVISYKGRLARLVGKFIRLFEELYDGNPERKELELRKMKRFILEVQMLIPDCRSLEWLLDGIIDFCYELDRIYTGGEPSGGLESTEDIDDLDDSDLPKDHTEVEFGGKRRRSKATQKEETKTSLISLPAHAKPGSRSFSTTASEADKPSKLIEEKDAYDYADERDRERAASGKWTSEQRDIAYMRDLEVEGRRLVDEKDRIAFLKENIAKDEEDLQRLVANPYVRVKPFRPTGYSLQLASLVQIVYEPVKFDYRPVDEKKVQGLVERLKENGPKEIKKEGFRLAVAQTERQFKLGNHRADIESRLGFWPTTRLKAVPVLSKQRRIAADLIANVAASKKPTNGPPVLNYSVYRNQSLLSNKHLLLAKILPSRQRWFRRKTAEDWAKEKHGHKPWYQKKENAEKYKKEQAEKKRAETEEWRRSIAKKLKEDKKQSIQEGWQSYRQVCRTEHRRLRFNRINQRVSKTSRIRKLFRYVYFGKRRRKKIGLRHTGGWVPGQHFRSLSHREQTPWVWPSQHVHKKGQPEPYPRALHPTYGFGYHKSPEFRDRFLRKRSIIFFKKEKIKYWGGKIHTGLHDAARMYGAPYSRPATVRSWIARIAKKRQRKKIPYLRIYTRVIEKGGIEVFPEVDATWVRPTRKRLKEKLRQVKQHWARQKKYYPTYDGRRNLLYPPTPVKHQSTMQRIEIINHNRKLSAYWGGKRRAAENRRLRKRGLPELKLESKPKLSTEQVRLLEAEENLTDRLEVLPPNWRSNRGARAVRKQTHITRRRPLNPVLYRQRLKPLLGVIEPDLNTRIASAREIKSNQPPTGLIYRLRSRYRHQPRLPDGRPGPKLWLPPWLREMRSKINARRFEIGLYRREFTDPALEFVADKFGTSGSVGYTRARPAFRTRFIRHRGWLPRVLPAPQQQPMAFFGIKTTRPHAVNRREELFSKYIPWNYNMFPIVHKILSRDRAVTPLRSYDWSPENVNKFIPSVESSVWSLDAVNPPSQIYSGSRSWNAELVRNAFVQESQRWLSSRLIEQAARAFPAKLLADYTLQNPTDPRSACDQFLEKSRNDLFFHNPNWWQQEAARRLEQFQTAKCGLNLKKPVTEDLLIQKCIINSVVPLVDLQHNALQYEDTQSYLHKQFKGIGVVEKKDKLGKNVFDAEDIKHGALHDLRRQGFETLLRRLKIRKNRLTSLALNEDRGPRLFDLGVPLPRFRNRGRRATSFESALRRYYEKVLSPAFRRHQEPALLRITPTTRAGWYGRRILPITTPSQRQQGRIIKQQNASSYRPYNWRQVVDHRLRAATKGKYVTPKVGINRITTQEKAAWAADTRQPSQYFFTWKYGKSRQKYGRRLITHSVVIGEVRKPETKPLSLTAADQNSLLLETGLPGYGEHGDGKKRFVSLSLRFLARKYIKKRALFKPLAINAVGSNVHALIELALNKRVVARKLRDLKKYVFWRKLIPEQRLPPWIVERLARKRLKQLGLKGALTYISPVSYQKKWENFWTTDNQELLITRARPPQRSDFRPPFSDFRGLESQHYAAKLKAHSNRRSVYVKTIPANLLNNICLNKKSEKMKKIARRGGRRRVYLDPEMTQRKLEYYDWARTDNDKGAQAQKDGKANVKKDAEKIKLWIKAQHQLSKKQKGRLLRRVNYDQKILLRVYEPAKKKRKSEVPVTIRLFLGRTAALGLKFVGRTKTVAVGRRRRAKADALQRSITPKLMLSRRPFPLTPFQFQQENLTVFKTEEVLAYELAEKRAAVRENYRLLDERITRLTSFFPAFLRWLIIKKYKLSSQTPELAKTLLQTIYWTLRCNSTLDTTEGKQGVARVATSLRFKCIRGEVARATLDRYFGREEEQKTRYRFQPYSVVKRRSQIVGLIYWYRQFLPQPYTLYREDPEKYSNLRPGLRAAYKGAISLKHPRNWETKITGLRPEGKFKNFIGTRAVMPRIETILVTSRRVPIQTKYGLDSGRFVYAKVGVERESFFERPFSTIAEPNYLEQQNLGFGVIKRRNRWIYTEEQRTPLEVRIKAKRVTKPILVAHSKASRTSSGRSGVGIIDPRLSRRKSIRNQDYIARQIRSTTSTTQLDHRRKHTKPFCMQRISRNQGLTPFGNTLLPHRSSFLVSDPTLTSSQVLNDFREEVVNRQSRTLLESHAAVTEESTKTSLFPPLLNLPTTPLWVVKRKEKSVFGLWSACAVKPLAFPKSARLSRSVLHSRPAKARSLRFNALSRNPRALPIRHTFAVNSEFNVEDELLTRERSGVIPLTRRDKKVTAWKNILAQKDQEEEIDEEFVEPETALGQLLSRKIDVTERALLMIETKFRKKELDADQQKKLIVDVLRLIAVEFDIALQKVTTASAVTKVYKRVSALKTLKIISAGHFCLSRSLFKTKPCTYHKQSKPYPAVFPRFVAEQANKDIQDEKAFKRHQRLGRSDIRLFPLPPVGYSLLEPGPFLLDDSTIIVDLRERLAKTEDLWVSRFNAQLRKQYEELEIQINRAKENLSPLNGKFHLPVASLEKRIKMLLQQKYTGLSYWDREKQKKLEDRVALLQRVMPKLMIDAGILQHPRKVKISEIPWPPTREKFHNTWFRVTGFKTKKYRLLKKWFMHTRRALKKRGFKLGRHGLTRQSKVQLAANLESYRLSRIRIRKLEWREYDDRFERKDFRKKATKFHISERRRIPWLESLIYPRTFFRTQRHRYRRDQAPQEYKSRKWLQYVRKAFATTNPKSLYIKGRRWPKLRIANYRFHLPMFELRNSRAAQRRLKKISRRNTRDSQFQRLMQSHGNRLDVTLILLNLASSPFWARALAPIGLIAVNGRIVYDRDYRLQPGDTIRFNIEKIRYFQPFFNPAKRRWEGPRLDRTTTAGIAKNFSYYRKTDMAVYNRFPTAMDIPRNSRLHTFLFTMFCHEAGRNRT